MSKPAVLLLAHGSPDKIEEIPAYLLNVTSGRELPPQAVAEVERRYRLIGHSPLTEISQLQAEALACKLRLPVYLGMRNWHPYIHDTVTQMAAEGVTEAVVLCLAPQNSRTSVGLYRRAVQSVGHQAPFAVTFVNEWHSEPKLIEAFAEKLRESWHEACTEAVAKLPVIFTAHSVPQRTIEAGDNYEAQARETAVLVAKRLPELGEKLFAFQSQGMSGGEWLGPTVEKAILQLKDEEHRGVLVQPVGFLCDHVEILYDIDIYFREFAARQGMHLWRAKSLNTSPLLIEALADIVRRKMCEGI